MKTTFQYGIHLVRRKYSNTANITRGIRKVARTAPNVKETSPQVNLYYDYVFLLEMSLLVANCVDSRICLILSI